MAEPFDSALTGLVDASYLIQEVYYPELLEHITLGGKITNRMVPSTVRKVGADGIRVHTESRRAFNAHLRRDPNGDFPKASPKNGKKLWFRFSDTAENNDFTTIDGAMQVKYSDLQIKMGSAYGGDETYIVDWVEDLIGDMREEFGYKLARARNTPLTAALFQQDGVAKQGDALSYAGASATPAAGTKARIKIDAGSIAMLKPGMRVVPYNGASRAYAGVLVIVDVNTADRSILVEDKDNPTTADYSAVGLADNRTFYEADESGMTEYNLGMYGPRAWLTPPGASDEFLHDEDGNTIDRASSDWMHLNPIYTRLGETTLKKIEPSDFDDLCLAMHYDHEASVRPVVSAESAVVQSLRSRLGEEAFRVIPINNETGKVLNLGSSAVTFEHPHIGAVSLIGDPMQDPNSVYFRIREDWESFSPMNKSITFPFRGEYGLFYAMQSAVPGNGKTRAFRLDATMTIADFCKNPKRQGVITNIKA